MENASKALIIAGAILLAISIIGIGMFVYQQAANTMGKINMNKYEIEQYNEAFERYVGTSVPGSTVRLLCDEVRNHNLQNEVTKNISIVTGTAALTTAYNTTDNKILPNVPNAIKASIGAGKTYTVTASYDSNTGLIVQIGVRENQ